MSIDEAKTLIFLVKETAPRSLKLCFMMSNKISRVHRLPLDRSESAASTVGIANNSTKQLTDGGGFFDPGLSRQLNQNIFLETGYR